MWTSRYHESIIFVSCAPTPKTQIVAIRAIQISVSRCANARKHSCRSCEPRTLADRLVHVLPEPLLEHLANGLRVVPFLDREENHLRVIGRTDLAAVDLGKRPLQFSATNCTDWLIGNPQQATQCVLARSYRHGLIRTKDRDYCDMPAETTSLTVSLGPTHASAAIAGTSSRTKGFGNLRDGVIA